MKKKIIWLDDDFELMNRSEEYFKIHGFDVFKCTSVAQALKLINEEKITNLLLDVDFPNSPKEGLLFLEQLRILKKVFGNKRAFF